MANLQGNSYSREERAILNKKVTNKDIILACYNPLVESLGSTVCQMTFAKPFYHRVTDKEGKINVKLSDNLNDIFNNIDAPEWAMIAQSDAFNLGIGVDSLGYKKNPDTNWIEYTAMERRPTDTFIRTKDSNVVTTSQRWKGIYYKNGVKMFDQTLFAGSDQGKIITLNPNQTFWVTPANAKFPDGPGIVEYLIPFLDGAQTAYEMTYVVMGEQLSPKDIIITDPQPGDSDIATEYIKKHNIFEKKPIPENIEIEYPVYKDRQDVLDFFKFFEKLMYRIVFPIAAISGEGGGILDNSSNLAKEDIFFSFVDFWRQKQSRAFKRLGTFLLDVNGYLKQGYRYELVAAPVAPRNVEIEAKIMDAAVKYGKITSAEYRAWLESSVVGLKLEEEFEDLMPTNLPTSATNKIVQDVVNGKKDPESLWEEKAKEVSSR